MTQSNLKEARHRVAQLRTALLDPSPAAVERCLPGLAAAADCLGRVQRELAQDNVQRELAECAQSDVESELHALKRELHGASRLIEHGAALANGWAKVLGAAVSGYTPSGEAAPVTAASKISVQG